ncbi:MAG TPA: NADH-quinone oxidoreductase subunit H [Actinomycetota bacterium]|nr:NADH-quinone oxidoreductase subunit H [Actinomycetota bacterium]
MRPSLSPGFAVLATGAAMAAGIYATAVLDEIVGGIVSGRGARAAGAMLAPVRRAAQLVLQRRAATERPDAEAWALAPALLAGLAAVGMAVVPFGPGLAVAGIDAGIVLFGAAMALVMVAVFLQGWSANSVFPVVGGYRFVAQALSYEMLHMLVLIAAALPARSLAVGDIVESQAHLWNVLRQPLGLPLYLVAAAGLAFWGPLRLPDAEDLAGGTSAELSGVALLLWRVAQRAMLVAVAAMGAAAFLGGWQGPLLPGAAWLALKTLALVALLVAARHLLARVPVERFMWACWVVLIPLALLDVFLGGAQALWAAP